LRHGGLSAAINAAFGITTGSYLTTLDADDYYSNVHLEDNVRYLKKHPEADLIMSKAKVLGDPYVVDLERPGKMIHLDRCVIGGTVFVKREIFRAVGGMAQIPYGMDYDFARRAEGAGYRIEKRNARTYVYDRTRSGSITKTAEMRMRTGELPDRRFSRAAPSSRGSAGRVTGAYGDFAAGGAEAGAAAASGNPRLRMRALVPASRPRKAR
jgi:glycosyltransferase involved in cell wall biosynthesis